MNKRMRELLEQIEAKTTEARGLMDGENKDVDKASEILDEVTNLKAEYETEKRLFELEKEDNAPKEEEMKKAEEVDSIVKFGRAAKAGFKTNAYDGTLNETVNADGGYTVPEDIVTKVEELREAQFSFLDLVRKVNVKTASGARTFKKRAQMTGFNVVGEAGQIGAAQAPEFDRITYSIKKYAGYLPITNELRYDSDANIAGIIMDWLADESRATANKLILGAINGAAAATDFSNLDGLKEALNVTLGAAFKPTSVIITNDDGLQYLDTLKREANSNEYLLQPNPTDPAKLQLRAGATVVPLHVCPNAIMPSTPTYSASTDTSVVAGKTYYTRSGSGTAESPYVYTKVTSPTGNPSTSSYYEMDSTPQIPFIVGDLNEGIVYFDRQQISIMESSIASIGSFNAFEQDLTVYRAIEREDVVVRDAAAFVAGYIQPVSGN